jgi:hypothetical protein
MRKAIPQAAKAQETLTRSSLKEHGVVRSPFAVVSRVGHVFVPAGELRPGDGDLLRSELDGLRSILEVRLKERTPKCLPAECRQQLKEFYRNRPEGHDVDHIVPQNGKAVSGLHVPWNLHYLPTADHIRKSNHLDYITGQASGTLEQENGYKRLETLEKLPRKHAERSS